MGNPGAGLAQAGYSDFAQLSARLARLTTQAGGLAQVRSLGKTATGKDIWLLTLGKGDPKTKPALALVAGVEGTHLAGTEVAVQLAEKLLANASQDSVAKLLETKTLYIIPLVNPDAAGQYFAKLKYERSGNARPTDDDRDGKLDEDGPEDLNGDGLITYVRVQDPTGTHKPHDKDPRVPARDGQGRPYQGRARPVPLFCRRGGQRQRRQIQRGRRGRGGPEQKLYVRLPHLYPRRGRVPGVGAGKPRPARLPVRRAQCVCGVHLWPGQQPDRADQVRPPENQQAH
ncbi:MAG: hypothetical protein MUC97_11270, partial [Bernardetiaceae bacterium]|nr:hypothetical protein [Bernardetiaceae bacterium]